MSKTDTTPQEGEAWRNEKGAIRYVRSVDDYSVVYSRPAPAHPDWITTTIDEWSLWVERMNAKRVRRGGGVQSDWEYIT